MASYLSLVLGYTLTWLMVAAGVVYAGMVLLRYRIDGPNYRLNFEPEQPTRSVQNFAIWVGVRALDRSIRIAKPILNSLLEASAEVGEWLMRRSPAVQRSVRSRFLV